MDDSDGLLEPLLAGLPAHDRSTVLSLLRQAQTDQLARKRHPPTRRRRHADGILAFREELQ